MKEGDGIIIDNFGNGPVIIYDKDCPFCNAYVIMVRLKENIGRVKLVNARELESSKLNIVTSQYDLNKGMILIYQGKLYYGYKAFNAIAALSSGVNLSNKINRFIFRHLIVSRIFYPIFASFRLITLRILGRPKI